MGFCIYATQRNILKESSSMEPIVKHKNNINFKIYSLTIIILTGSHDINQDHLIILKSLDIIVNT